MREQSAFWPYELKQFSRGKFKGKLLAVHTKRIQLSLAYRSQGIFIRGGVPPGTTAISFPLSHANSLFYRGQTLQNNHVIALEEDEEIELHTSDPSTLLTVAVSNALLDQHAVTLTGKSFSELRCQERLFVCQKDQSHRTSHLVSLLKALNGPDCACCETKLENIENEILETILVGVSPYETNNKKTYRLAQAKKAEEYIRSNIKRPLPIRDLCLASGASERTLHLGFKERFGLSPKAFIKIMRLNEVRRELLQKKSNGSVTDIALSWGFNHLSRFAEQYNQMFGELPSKTKKYEPKASAFF